MALADPSPAAAARALSGLPLDVLRLIVAKLDLQDRLRLEALDRSHREIMREPELWQDIRLGGGRALEIKEEQLLILISRIDHRMQAASHIAGMTAALQDITQSYLGHDPLRNPKLDSRLSTPGATLGSPFSFIEIRVLYQAVPETWGPLRLIAETCTVWVVEQVNRIPKAARKLFSACQKIVRDPAAIVGTLKAKLTGQVKLEGKPSAKKAVSLNVTGGTKLSPAFLAACTIALSAAGYHVDLTMDGESDPGFLVNHPVHDVIRSLALDCSLHVNLLVSGKFPWTADCLEGFGQGGQLQAAVQPETVEAKVERVAASIAPHYKGSSAACQNFLDKVWSLVEFRAAVAGKSGSAKGATAKVVSETVVLEHLVEVEPLLLEALRRCSSPEKLQLAFRNCLLPANGFRSLFAVLGERGTGRVALQQHSPFENPQVAALLLACAELQSSTGLKVLELDLPLSPADLDSVALFLDRNLNGAEVVIHLRPAFYFKSGQLSQRFFSQLRGLCLSERSARLRIVRYRGGAPLSKGRAAEDPGSLDAFLSPVQQEIRSKLRIRKIVGFVDRSISFLLVGDLLVVLATLVDWLLGLGWLSFMTKRAKVMAYQLAMAMTFLWPSIQASLLGRLDLTGTVYGLCVSGFLPMTWIDLAIRSLPAYLGACLVWTIARCLLKAAAGCFRHFAAKVREPQELHDFGAEKQPEAVDLFPATEKEAEGKTRSALVLMADLGSTILGSLPGSRRHQKS
ncbi:hypothetical protein KFL_003090070 [Klebsormidium nitens]|uniref:F-box domain-containing protein n=1 Tax=Klebsormidium nitens TaxID=105231 RepID=A0A1Y1I729_KLENI|nr:hypothetical protein KFL_003090070 [Klebsormidium nitens]|eukprot:GAQ86750.1 hypothetical protein KFL_003090070 [Klebsormidium nitens]